MAEQTCPCCGSNLRVSCNEDHPQYDTYHPEGHERPQPDWADLREMARNAGWTPDTWTARDVHWGQREPKRSLRTDLGWVSSRHFQGHHRVELHGPEPRPIRTVALINPTPAEVLAAGRLVGLIGAAS